MNAFQDRVVWITGASSGYGAALASAFDEAGAKVIISARTENRLRDVAGGMRNARIIPLDLGQASSFAEKTMEAIAAFGHVDLIIHNGALGQNGSVLETRPEVAREIMEIDYFSYTELTRCILPHFIARKSGQIIVVSGLIVAATAPGRSSYAAAKAALFGYFGCLRAELVEYDIDVTILIPGAMKTDLVAKALKADGSVVGGAGSTVGCSAEEAAKQSLEVIARREYQTYVGDDSGRERWNAFLSDPSKTIEMLLAHVKAQRKRI